jgi:hypothetical protein
MPVEVVTDATKDGVLTQVPPEGADARVMVVPVHTTELPEMAVGMGFTDIKLVVMQPVGNE